MTPQKETELRIMMKEFGEVTVDILDMYDNITERTYTNIDEALNEIRVLENEHTVYF